MNAQYNIPTIDVKQYGGKQVAILDGQIIAAGTTLKEVIGKVKAKAPSRPLSEIKIFAVPTTLAVIYYVSGISLRHHTPRRRGHCRISSR